MYNEENKAINFDLPKNQSNVIKVIGVGGGGSNAINYMFLQGIKGVDFVITNTDAQALSESGVPIKVQLGASLTEGLGAGANPEVGALAAKESEDQIKSILSTQTKMIFITAGMGGGTGTGAAPIIAKMAKEMDILTVGIVTMPFQFEGRLRLDQAQKGLEKLKETVDALIVINNNKLREVYGNLGFKSGFAKADEVLATAARGIAEVITHHYTQNIDLKDAKTVLTNSGTAIMGSACASGSNRAQEAIIKALDSPLLNDNKINGSKNVLLLIVSGSDEITIDEIGEINDYIQTEAGNQTNIIMGVGEDENLGNEISVTIIATGFAQEQQNQISNTEAKKIIHSLEDDQKIVHNLSDENDNYVINDYVNETSLANEENFAEKKQTNSEALIPMNPILYNIEVEVEILDTCSDLNDFEKQSDEFYKNFKNTSKEEKLFELNFESVTEEDNESDSNKTAEITTDPHYDSNTEKDFVFNDLDQLAFSMDVIDPEIVDHNDQVEIDFNTTISNRNEENDAFEDNIFKKIDFDDSTTEVKFEAKSDQETKHLKNPNLHLETDTEPSIDSQIDNSFDKTIDDTVSFESKKRKAHLEKFNHKFSKQYQKIDKFEKEPAYKRKGIKIDNTSTPVPSRLSIDNDSNDDLQIRSNNSFLHDNVD
tara:strand:- start:186 stop:2147 length:1962 start_codon:yes stop_codon:yes gene_type:complete